MSVPSKYLGLIFALLGLVFIYGCSTSSNGGDHAPKNSEKTVRYSFDCENLVCQDTSNIIDFNSGDHRAKTCIWNCGTGYKQCLKAQVTLKFERVNGCWQLTHDQLSSNYEGACN